MAARQGRDSGGAGVGAVSRMQVTIMGVDYDTSRVMCRESFGSEFEIDGTLRPKGTGMPATGERWVLTKIGNRWTLEVQIGVVGIPIITGDREDLHPIVAQMLDAMAAQGLVLDQTTGAEGDEILDDDTDPYTDEPGAEPYVDDELDLDPNVAPISDVPKGDATDDDSIPGSAVAQDLFTAVSYNQVYSMGNERAKKDLARLYEFADVIGLQECVSAQRTVALNARDTSLWGMYRPGGAGIGNVILWRKAVFKHLDEGTHQLSAFDGVGTKRPARGINWVLLEHIPSKTTLIFADFHWENQAAKGGFYDPTYTAAAPRHIERFKEQMEGIQPILVGLAKRAPVLFVGDFNVRSPDDLRLRNPGLPTVALGRIGFRSNWEILGQPPIGTSVHSNTVLDWMMLSNKIPNQMKFVSSKVLRGYYSDHRPVVSKIRIRTF